MSEGSDADRHDPQIKGEDNKETLLSLTTQANWGKSPLFLNLYFNVWYLNFFKKKFHIIRQA